jgi:transposase InsO family protein
MGAVRSNTCLLTGSGSRIIFRTVQAQAEALAGTRRRHLCCARPAGIRQVHACVPRVPPRPGAARSHSPARRHRHGHFWNCPPRAIHSSPSAEAEHLIRPRDVVVCDVNCTSIGILAKHTSSCSAIGGTATRSRSPTSPAATCWRVRRSRRRRRNSPSPFERTSKEFGLPGVIRTDNGVPFASAHALYGLSKLSVWWLRLGIQIERIKPGHPQQNGRHERMHLTLKKDATKPAAPNVLQQQARFDAFMAQYNRVSYCPTSLCA